MLLKRTILFFAVVSIFLQNRDARAFGIDFLGEIAKPLVGPTQEKLKSMLVYIWVQPYAGYGFGTNDQTRTTAGGAITRSKGLKSDGFFYGGRGGILLIQSFRVGVDYSVQNLKRESLVENSSGVSSKQPVSGKNTMVGAILGFDVPFTPVQGFVTKYFKATMNGDSATEGDGWGGGISFVLKNPFIFSLESRKLNYSSAADPTGKKASGSFTQYYASMSFMLF